jgi:hypothetical protein
MANLAGLLMLTAMPAAAPSVAAEGSSSPAVVFVCEHGSVKSMIAALWFNRLASERGLRIRAESRGVDPDARIPDAIARHLRDDGFDLSGMVPTRLQGEDLTKAAHVVAIGATSPLFEGLASVPERWDDIPPASVDYRAARDAMRLRLGSLVDALVRRQSAEQRP